MVMIRNLKVPTSFRLALTYCAVLFVSAFMPILYIVILTLNGAFLIPFRSVFTNHDVWVNSICSLVFITFQGLQTTLESVGFQRIVLKPKLLDQLKRERILTRPIYSFQINKLKCLRI